MPTGLWPTVGLRSTRLLHRLPPAEPGQEPRASVPVQGSHGFESACSLPVSARPLNRIDSSQDSSRGAASGSGTAPSLCSAWAQHGRTVSAAAPAMSPCSFQPGKQDVKNNGEGKTMDPVGLFTSLMALDKLTFFFFCKWGC